MISSHCIFVCCSHDQPPHLSLCSYQDVNAVAIGHSAVCSLQEWGPGNVAGPRGQCSATNFLPRLHFAPQVVQFGSFDEFRLALRKRHVQLERSRDSGTCRNRLRRGYQDSTRGDGEGWVLDGKGHFDSSVPRANDSMPETHAAAPRYITFCAI